MVKQFDVLDPNGEYWMYLRKSRADLEAEARGEGETLDKHRKALFKLAKDYNINITRVFPEIASGESIFHRPEMVSMLQSMETDPPNGVLVMDIDRLGRGDKIDQGVIERSFKESKALIITPTEIYDMNQESGEFSVEVRSFLARMELKQTTKRLQGGRVRSVEEGNYIGTRPPYGYQIEKTGKGERMLILHPEQAPVVKLIFELYTHTDPHKRLGTNKIANELNRLKYPTYSGKPWEASSVLSIIKNAVYIGRIQWKKKEQKKSKIAGKKRDTRTRPIEEWIDVQGKHEPLISEEQFKLAHEILKYKYHVPYHLENGITNPLAGLIKCDKCGSSMVYRPYVDQPGHLMCYNRKRCDNKSSRFQYVEQKLVEALEQFVAQLKVNWGNRKNKEEKNVVLEAKESALKGLEKELTELEGQKGTLHDFLERRIYDIDTYLHRSRLLSERIETTKQTIEQVKSELSTETKKDKAQKTIIPKFESVLKAYQKEKDPAKKNMMLKSVLEYATYRKEKTQRNDEFTLSLYTKLPD
jgi:DNA invertase Pin-like site-specific DNA recombinase